MAEPESNITLRMTREQAFDFFQSIAEDPAFRDRFEGDPRGALGEKGIEIVPDQAIPEKAKLPPMYEVEELLKRLSAKAPPFGRAAEESYRYALFAVIWGFPAIPYIEAAGPGDGAR